MIGAMGAVIGLTMAGFSLFTAKGTRHRGVPPEAAALVNGHLILQSDLTAQVASTVGVPFSDATPKQRRTVLKDMIREELFVQRGLETDEPSVDSDTRAALVSAVQQQVDVDVMSQTPTELGLRDYYARHASSYLSLGAMTVHDLVPVADEGGAWARLREAGAALGGGAHLRAVESRYRLKESGRADGEQLYFAAKLNLGATLFGSAAPLRDGEVAGPVSVADGPHLLWMQHNAPPKPRSFEEARGQVAADYREAMKTRMRQSEYLYLLRRAEIEIAAQDR